MSAFGFPVAVVVGFVLVESVSLANLSAEGNASEKGIVFTSSVMGGELSVPVAAGSINAALFTTNVGLGPMGAGMACCSDDCVRGARIGIGSEKRTAPVFASLIGICRFFWSLFMVS